MKEAFKCLFIGIVGSVSGFICSMLLAGLLGGNRELMLFYSSKGPTASTIILVSPMILFPVFMIIGYLKSK
jgi:hypothetical protein